MKTFKAKVCRFFLYIYAFLFSAAALCLLSASGCASAQPKLQVGERPDQLSGPVWPPPPQSPRILYVASISGYDFQSRKSWIQKVFGAVFGEDEQIVRLVRPYDVVALSDVLYVTDPGSQVVHILDLKNKEYSSIKGTGKEDFVSPIGISVDKQGDIFVTDSILRKVFVFNSKGKFLKEIGSPDILSRPTGIAVCDNVVYVVDTRAHCVLAFDMQGRHLFSFGQNGILKGQFHYPTHIYIDKANLIYVTDSLNFRVQIFDRKGNFISSFGKHGDGSGDFAGPKGIAVDSDGHVYVSDAHFDNIQIFDTQGRLLLSFGEAGRRKGQLLIPAGLSFDERDRIYVADSYNNRIQIFQYVKRKESD